MKKMKKLNLNKIRVVSLRNLQIVNGGHTGTPCTDTHTCPDPTTTLDPDTCYSTGRTDPFGGGTFSVNPGNTNACITISNVLTECELEP